VRTRMYGGVGGGRGNPPADPIRRICQFSAHSVARNARIDMKFDTVCGALSARSNAHLHIWVNGDKTLGVRFGGQAFEVNILRSGNPALKITPTRLQCWYNLGINLLKKRTQPELKRLRLKPCDLLMCFRKLQRLASSYFFTNEYHGRRTEETQQHPPNREPLKPQAQCR